MIDADVAGTRVFYGDHYVLGPFGPDCDLKRHGLQLAARGGRAAKKKAVVAIARKLAVLMLTLWYHEDTFIFMYIRAIHMPHPPAS